MSLKKSIRKTKNLLLKTLKNLKNIPFVSYDHNLPKPVFLNPLSCTTINRKPQFPTQSFTGHRHDTFENSMNQTVKTSPSHDATDDDHETVTTFSYDISTPVKQISSIPKIEPSSTTSSCRYAIDGAYILAQKMKELDMMEVGEVDHVLDIEEALNYYSRLSCPVYVDIVDKFFLDMYDDFLVPQPSVNLSSSSRRLGPLKI